MADIVGQYNGTNTSEVLVGTNTNDTIDHKGGDDIIDGGEGIDTVLFKDSKNNFSITTVAGITHVVGSDIAAVDYRNTDAIITSVENLQFNDGTVPLAGIAPSGLILGSSARQYSRETITGTNGDDTIDPRSGGGLWTTWGLSGYSTVSGLTIDGGGGNDTVAFFDSKDNFLIHYTGKTVYVTGKSTAASQYRSTETILENVETIQFIEWITGTNGDDSMDALRGNATIDGGRGNDTVKFSDSKNNFFISSIAGITHIIDSTADPSQYNNASTILMNVETLQFTDGAVTLPAISPTGVMFAYSSGSWITGTSGDNIIDPLHGVNTIDGGAGNDTLVIFDSKNNFSINTVSGVTHVIGSDPSTDVYHSCYIWNRFTLMDVETIQFMDGSITLPTKSSKGVIFGIYTINAPDDDNTIEGLGSNDTIDGGAGNDTAIIFDSKNSFTITTVCGITHLVGSNTLASAKYRGADTILMNVEKLEFLDGIVALPGTKPISVIFGQIGSQYSYPGETITCFSHNDVIDHRGGNDTIDGGDGVDNVLFFDNKSNFTITTISGVIHVKGSNTAGDAYNNTDTQLTNVEKITFLDTAIMFDTQGVAGQAYRIYQAAFDRKPDLSGLGFWIDSMDKGTSLQTVANGFVNSSEFQTMYGLNPSPDTFLSKLYNNVLHRAYDQSGFDFWLSTLNSGANSQAAVLAQFSESPENQEAVISVIGNGIEYMTYSPIL